MLIFYENIFSLTSTGPPEPFLGIFTLVVTRGLTEKS